MRFLVIWFLTLLIGYTEEIRTNLILELSQKERLTKSDDSLLLSYLKENSENKPYKQDFIDDLSTFFKQKDQQLWPNYLNLISSIFPISRQHLGFRNYELRDFISKISQNKTSDLNLLNIFHLGNFKTKEALYNHLKLRYAKNLGFNFQLWQNYLLDKE